MPLTGEAKRRYNVMYHARRTGKLDHIRPREVKVIEGIAEGKSVAQALQGAGFSASSTSLRERLRPGGDLAEALRVLLTAKGLTMDALIGKAKDKLDAQRRYGSGEDAVIADDNDAQLRAVEIGLRLHERAGTIPAQAQSGAGNVSLTVVEVNYHQS